MILERKGKPTQDSYSLILVIQRLNTNPTADDLPPHPGQKSRERTESRSNDCHSKQGAINRQALAVVMGTNNQ